MLTTTITKTLRICKPKKKYFKCYKKILVIKKGYFAEDTEVQEDKNSVNQHDYFTMYT